jgi:hypothetical protein
MDAKVIIYGLCLVAIIAGASFWSYTMGIDDAQKDVISARQQSAVAEEGIKQAKAWLTARKEASALLAASRVIERDNLALRTEVDAIKSKRKDIAKVFQSSVDRARTETAGMSFPKIQLSTGEQFKNAKIQSVDKEITVFQHAEGVSKVPTRALPPDLLDRLRYDSIPGVGGGRPTSGTKGGSA